MAVDFDGTVLKAGMDTFGETVTYTPQGEPAFTLTAVFDAAHEAVEMGDITLSSVHPVIGVRLSDFPVGVAPATGDLVDIGTDLYRVIDPRPDGQGGATLVMHRRA